MPKTPTQLSDLAARKAKSKDAAYTLASGRGLFLVVLPTGIKQWMVRFQTPEGKRGNRIIGIYPDMGIADAHKASEELRQRVRMGDRPEGMYDRRRAERASLTEEQAEAVRIAEEARRYSFTVISDAWLEDRKPGWAPATYDKSTFIVQKRLQPLLGRADMRTLASKDVVPVLVDLAANMSEWHC